MQHLKQTFSSADVLEKIRSVLPGSKKSARLHEPYFAGNEWNYLKECLDSGWVSSVGPFVDKFEKKLQELTGAAYVLALVNGTAALHAALLMSGVQENDEVLIPDLTFVATANAVTYCGAIPHFVDSDWKTLGVDAKKLEDWLKKNTDIRGNELFNRNTGKRIKALIAVHIFGHPADMDELVSLCRSYHLDLIEDAAESLGSYYKNKHTGIFGKYGILSFNGNKIATTGGGGALLTNDIELGKKVRHIMTTAKVPHAWRFDHDTVGYNYRMPNINAALGLAQLEALPGFVTKKRALAAKYEEVFKDLEGIQFFKEPAFAKSNYWLNTLALDGAHASKRDQLLAYLNENDIQSRPAWTLMHKLPMFKHCPKTDVSVAEEIESRTLNIPSSAFLS